MTPINQVELILTTLLNLGSLTLYSFVPWYRSWFGRVIWTLLLSLTLISLLVTLSSVFGAFPGREVMRHLVYLLTTGTSLMVFVSLSIAQLQGRKIKHAHSAISPARGRTDR